ncbi:glycosyltransferase family 2 protein [Candidatus Roizmanbacteria bacterium]|nr:glycosyltransferase family 2 protein [Candidatus Roizmanbacteria bacterium]
MLSVIVPFHNEAESLKVLYPKLIRVAERMRKPYEVIFVDDGSTDESISKLQSKNQKEQIKIIAHRKRLGKGRALLSGFQASKGDVLVFMDADLQDDPEDIPVFLSAIEKGYDLINGWRKERVDPLHKTVPSFILNNLLLKPLLRSRYHDVNCGFKAMRRTVLEQIPLYGDNYRFIPILAEKEGFKTSEVPVKHKPRKYGRSKYGVLRLFSGFFDTVTTYFIFRFSEKPLHFFGPVGLIIFLVGFGISLYLTIERLFFGVLLFRRPALLLGVLLIIVGIQIVMTGVIGELLVYLSKKQQGA